MMDIRDLVPDDEQTIARVAALLVDGFKEHWALSMESALREVHASLGPDRLSRVARDEQSGVVGWISGIRQYDGRVWELHPLVVRRDRQGRGIGRALVTDLEERVWERAG